ncbi:hypothetical protein CEUSTIGMA_g6088.t1 [Chlamydomonas eustigma]|uniref:Glycosyl transferase 64 domain-containing protein n=1 Tax=Chlamydomonas eustigma TaxID=1157962 RepID=A0A250X7B4_9CHLO|nr:hypothetical protein CEUSTIGMA_g6088.t1 [Chlamydomonas eustigma]|eukprot:GAX78650.1 hypothetical protein CEUSTIGMA_g6088.t1 [Chlamydomonas eustigma]
MTSLRTVIVFATITCFNAVLSLKQIKHEHEGPRAVYRSLASEAARSAHRSDHQVTVVIMNWQRPDNVIHIARIYVTYESIAEIIIWMCHPDTKFKLSLPKVRIIDDVSANDKYGLSIRFKACLLAKTPWVFIQDDDHYIKKQGLSRMLMAKQKYPQRIIGVFGRDWPHGPSPQYIRKPVQYGPSRIALTVMLLSDVETCKAFWKYAPLVEPYVREHSSPLWNGEDIFFSLVSYKAFGQVPLIVKARKAFLSQEKKGIHFGGGHDNYRDDFLKYAVEILGIQYPDYPLGKIPVQMETS